MNVIFLCIMLVCLIFACFTCPDIIIPSMIAGGEKAITLSVTMLAIYSCYLGFLNIAVSAGLTTALSKAISPITKKLFYNPCQSTLTDINLNLSANLLGIGGIATPLGINAMQGMEKQNNPNGMCMLFVITATSIQILPTTVIALRSTALSTSPSSIFLPSLLTTFVSTTIGILLCKVFESKS